MSNASAQRVCGEATLPFAVAAWARGTGQHRVIFVAPDDATMQALQPPLAMLLPQHRVIALPAWDALPYDRGRPSSAVACSRVAALTWLAEAVDQPALIITTPESLPQRIPPASRLTERAVTLTVGDQLDPVWLRTTLEAFGYVIEERVNDPGDVAIRAGTVDVFPAGEALPLRLELDDLSIIAIRIFNPLSQRSTGETSAIRILPASEAFTVPGEPPAPGQLVADRLLPEGPLSSLLDLLPKAGIGLAPETEERLNDWLALVRDSHAIAVRAVAHGGVPPPPPDDLFLSADEMAAALRARAPTRFIVDEAPGEPALPAAAVARRAAACLKEGDAVVVCIADGPQALRSVLARRMQVGPETIALLDDWQQAEAFAPGQLGVLRLALPQGFRQPGRTVLAVRAPEHQQLEGADALRRLASGLRIGDVVVDPEHGLARLEGLVFEEQAGAPTECVSLVFLGGQRLLVPVVEIGRLWRYGSASNVALDRLSNTGWTERRAEAEKAITAAAVQLVERLRSRQLQSAPVIELGAEYQRFVRRMPFAASADQVRAIRDVRADVAKGHPMRRLICGDVGFGKTEVALHAAAMTALAGQQVAVVAPTTVLAAQHLETFRRRLGPLGLRIEPLIRSARSAAGKAYLRRIAEGEVDIVVATHAVATARLPNLGLVIIDEEQRFGEAQKRALRSLGEAAHALVMTATPLPRSLQGALLGLIDVSLLTHPPAPRLPIRAIAMPLDPSSVRIALLREARRGGQSFVICPRVADLQPMQDMLQELVPELSLAVVHGRLPADELDGRMMRFAAGAHDVLLSTNIIEAGLDLPNANTMLIWRADRFGLAQLHQLRGRVGRGRQRAVVYFLTDPAAPPGTAARRRLETLCGLAASGSGFSISLHDLDQRGAGDLLGEDQAGHLHLIGSELYQHVLDRALARARGEAVDDAWEPMVVADASGFLPADYVAEADERVEIYHRLGRIETAEAIEDILEELTDRFGSPPPQAITLLELFRLKISCRHCGIAAIHVGPSAVAITPRSPEMDASALAPTARWKGDRIVVPSTGNDAGTGAALAAAWRLVQQLCQDKAEW